MNRRMIKDLKDRGNNNEKPMQLPGKENLPLAFIEGDCHVED